MRATVVTAMCVVVATACGSGGSHPGTTTGPTPTPSAAWADEFDAPVNAAPDSTKWTYDLGGGGWGNQELESYTSSTDNVHLDGQGHLVIRVLSAAGTYSSARLKTQGRFTAQYAHIDASIKLPAGRGIWPAFWMLGASITTAGWPACGEIDVMENIGSPGATPEWRAGQPSVNHGSAHGPGYSGGNSKSATYALPANARFADAFHTFAIDWAPGTIAFLVDGAVYHTVTRATIPAGTAWVFDAPFFLLLNVAVGGSFPGPPDATTMFPQEMVVDYVRYVPRQ